MIALMERTCRISVKSYLEEGQETVGTLVNVTHDSATPIGMKVRCDSELIGIDRRKLTFKVNVFDEKGQVGKGIHERFIIDVNKFQAKTESKKQ